MGTGVDITFDPRTIGMQIDDEIMQKSLKSKIFLIDAKYAVTITIEVLDGRIFLSGDVDDPETKIQITKHAWETKGVRSVKNLLTIKGDTKFKTNVFIPRLCQAWMFSNRTRPLKPSSLILEC